MEYNWIKTHGGVRYDTISGRFEIDPEKSLAAMKLLSDEFVHVQMIGNYDHAQAFINAWGSVPSEVPEIVARFDDLPVEVFPKFNLSF